MNTTTFLKVHGELVQACLKATVYSDAFEDWEFHSLFGFMRSEIKDIVDRWPEIDFFCKDISDAIHNSMGNLLGYPHGKDLVAIVGYSKNEIGAAFNEWVALQTDRDELNP